MENFPENWTNLRIFSEGKHRKDQKCHTLAKKPDDTLPEGGLDDNSSSPMTKHLQTGMKWRFQPILWCSLIVNVRL